MVGVSVLDAAATAAVDEPVLVDGCSVTVPAETLPSTDGAGC